MREELKEALAAALKSVGISASEVFLEHTADLKNGDYSSGAAMRYAKRLGMPPRALAEKIAGQLRSSTTLGPISIRKIEIAGAGFINFYLAPQALAASIEKARKEDTWGSNALHKGRKIMVEYTDPNPFKEFHIGHLMSNAIGESISRLLQFSGAEVKRANYQGDVGPHVAKAIWGLRKLRISPHDSAELGKAYATGAQAYENDAKAKEEIDGITAKVYDHFDSEINKIYDAGRKVSLAHFEELYRILGTKFDYYFFESETAPYGLALVKAHPEVFEESDGAIVYKGEQDGLHTRVFVTSKGLPTYETKDLGLAQMKSKTWPCDVSITITAHEQREYFAVVLAAMKKVLPEIARKIRHVSHGMMRLPSGKMSSRKGDIVTGESLLNELIEVAKARAIESRADDKEKLAQDVAVAAIKYQILKQASGKDIIFDRERALSLEGDSGPYLQYAHARTHAVVERAKEQNVTAKVDAKAEPSELTRLLHRFPEVVERAAEALEPHFLTTHLLEIASQFNSWYAREQILDGSANSAHKVALTEAVRRALKNGLWILGIPAPEKM